MHQREAASASIALAPITDFNRTRWWQQVPEKCYIKCYLVKLLPFRIAACVADVSFEGLLTRCHSQTGLPCTPSLRRFHEVGLPHDRCCTGVPDCSTKLTRILRLDRSLPGEDIKIHVEDVICLLERAYWPLDPRNDRRKSASFDYLIRPSIKRRSGLLDGDRWGNWLRLERGCIGMDHALYFPPENNIGVTENVCPHCELNVLIVNI